MLRNLLLLILFYSINCDTYFPYPNPYDPYGQYCCNHLIDLPKPKDWQCPKDNPSDFCPGITLARLESLICVTDKDCQKHGTYTNYKLKCCDHTCYKRKMCRNGEPVY